MGLKVNEAIIYSAKSKRGKRKREILLEVRESRKIEGLWP